MDDDTDLFRWVRLPASRAGKDRAYLAEHKVVNRVHGHGLERRFVARLGSKAVSAEAFGMLYPGLQFRDDTNRGTGSLGNGPGASTMDGILTETNALAGGYGFQVKTHKRWTDKNGNEIHSSELALLTGTIDTINGVIGHQRVLWHAHGRSLPVLIIQTDWVQGADPDAAKVLAFAVVNVSTLIRDNRRYAGVVNDHYEWSDELGMHISKGVHKARGKAMNMPLYVRLKKASKTNKTTSHYPCMCVSLSFLRERGMLQWVECASLEESEVTAMMRSAIRKVARSR